MLTEKEIEIINQNLKSGFDVEIQQRKKSTVIVRLKKDICYRSEKTPETNNPKDTTIK